MANWRLDYDALMYAAKKAGYTHKGRRRDRLAVTRLAGAAGIDKATMTNISKGRYLGHVKTLASIADVLNCDVLDLLEKVD